MSRLKRCLTFTATVLLALPLLALAGPHTVILTADQEVALSYATEQANAAQTGKLDADGKALPPITLDAMALQILSADLANVLRNLDASVITPVLPNLKALDAATLAKVVAGVSSAAVKARIAAKLAEK